MSTSKKILFTLLAGCILFFSSGSDSLTQNKTTGSLVLMGSTPCDSMMKSIFSIPQNELIDFMRWDLSFTGTDQNNFILILVYGESQPNTLGFRQGGKSLTISGQYSIVQSNNKNLKGKVYLLRGTGEQRFILSMVRLNDNLFHLLTNDNRLFIGNGGWSYTLNRKDPVIINNYTQPVVTDPSVLLSQTALKTVFDGRTPCRELSEEYDLPAQQDCFKIKWRLTLMRDPVTLAPSEYILDNVFTRKKSASGIWTIVKGTKENTDAVIYRLDPDKKEKSLSFLAGDENILYFLDKNDRLFTGNGDFSYTLNRVK